MKSRAPVLLLLGLCACAASPSPTQVAKCVAAPTENAAAIARVETGLIPERPVAGETKGWSIEERLRAHHTPAVSIAVIDGHRVAWARAYGVRDRRSGAPADSTTPCQAASISKMVTALAALRLAEAGKVGLDADVNDALKSWKLPENDSSRATPVTLSQLLAHTGGINLRSVMGYPADTTLPTLPQILDGLPPSRTPAVRVVHPPGKEFHYSGGGSMIAQQIVVDVTGQGFDAALRDLIFRPLGMAHSTFAVPPPPAVRSLALEAHDYDGTVFPDTVYPESAPAGLWTTPTDLARFLVEIQLGAEGRSRVVSRETAARMTTPVAPIGAPDVWTGLGTFIEKRGDTLYFGHDGHNDGYLAMSRATVEGGKGAVVMTNSVAAAPLIFEIMRSIAVEYRWKGWLKDPIQPVAVAPEQLQSLPGRYGAGADDSVRLAVNDSRLELSEPFREPVVLHPVGGDIFMSVDDGKFEVRSQGEAHQLIITPSGEPARELQRREGDEASPLELVAAGKHDEALARYLALRASNPDDPALKQARFDDLATELLERRLDTEGAIRVFRVEAALHPESTYAVAGLAMAYLRAGKRDEAEPFHRKALALYEARTKGTEVEEIYLGLRMKRLKSLLTGAPAP